MMRHFAFLLCGWGLLACQNKVDSFADQQSDTEDTDENTDAIVDSDGDGIPSTEDCDDTDA